MSNYTKEIKVIVPEGYRDVLSLDTSRPARICFGSKGNCKTSYRVKVTAMLTKIPGFYFTGYQSAQFYGAQLVAESQYKELLDDYFSMNEGSEDAFYELIGDYDFSNDVPKYKMFIKLNESISDDRRD